MDLKKFVCNVKWQNIHRSDYINNTSYVINYDKYYKSAIEYIESRYNNIHFYIFSDDIEY